MADFKLDELVCLTTWSMAWIDGKKDADKKATEKEMDITRAMRAFFKMNTERFNEKWEAAKPDRKYLKQLPEADIITRIACYYGALKVGWAENEGETDENLSDAEWEYAKKILSYVEIPEVIRAEIKTEGYNFIEEIGSLDYIEDDDLIDLIDFEKEDGVIYDRSIKPLLKVFFKALEKNNLYDSWEENYLGILKHKPELEEIYGVFNLKEFDDRYK